MRSYETARDVLKLAEDFHSQVADLYQSLSDRAGQKRVKMLLDHLGRHERRLSACLAEFEKHDTDHVLETWFQFSPGNLPAEGLPHVEVGPDMTIDDVVSMGLRLDQCLIEIYRQAHDECESKELKEVFANLLEMEKRETTRLLRDALELKTL